MNLIIISKLTCNEGLYFRFITMVAKLNLDYDILIEAKNKKEIDKYYKILKDHGWFDFIDDFILPNQEDGVRLDTEMNYSMTIRTPYIRCENVTNLLGQIKTLRNI